MSSGIRICCRARICCNSRSWLVIACLMDCQASKRSNWDILRYCLRSQWIPSTRDVAIFPKCGCRSTQALTNCSLYGSNQYIFRYPTSWRCFVVYLASNSASCRSNVCSSDAATIECQYPKNSSHIFSSR